MRSRVARIRSLDRGQNCQGTNTCTGSARRTSSCSKAFASIAPAAVCLEPTAPRLPNRSRAVALLRLLLERQGKLVSKDDIMKIVWSGMAIEEANLTVQISALRRVLDRGRE